MRRTPILLSAAVCLCAAAAFAAPPAAPADKAAKPAAPAEKPAAPAEKAAPPADKAKPASDKAAADTKEKGPDLGVAKPGVEEILKTIDARLRSPGDYKAVVEVNETLRDQTKVQYELYVYRRDATKDLLILITAPKASAGAGFLRIDRNLWEYDPTVGQWARRTIRANIGGTSTNASDYDLSNLAGEYDGTEEAAETVGKIPCRRFYLKEKAGVDAVYPAKRIWVDKDMNVVKQESYAASGKKLRSWLSPDYNKVHSPEKNQDLYFSKEIFIFDEERGSKAEVKIKKVDLRPLEANIFTKGWLEARSR